jgi:hypothetical protein
MTEGIINLGKASFSSLDSSDLPIVVLMSISENIAYNYQEKCE